MKSAGKARSNGLYRHIRTSKEIIRNLLNDYYKNRIFDIISKKIAENSVEYFHADRQRKCCPCFGL